MGGPSSGAAGGSPEPEFLIALYESRVSSIFDQQRLRWEWQKFALIGTFGFYAAIFSNQFGLVGSLIFPIAVWAPFLLNILGFYISISIRQNVISSAKILLDIEVAFSAQQIGWEHFRRAQRHEKGLLSIPVTVSTYVFWVTMIAVSVFVPIFTQGIEPVNFTQPNELAK